MAIIGLGLMGGSLARALKGLPSPPHIRGLTLDALDARAAMNAGALDEVANAPDALLRDRDLVVYATPLGATLSLMEAHRAFLPPDTVISDVASLKGPVLNRARDLGIETRYAGSHPMVGGVASGFANATDGLYRGARVWIVPGAPGERGPASRIRSLWRSLGADPGEIEASEHDRVMVWVSHLPQLASNALAVALMRAGFGRGELGPGGRDMTRLAGSSPQMWTDILASAPEALPEALRETIGTLEELRRFLLEGDLAAIGALLGETRKWAEEE